MYKLRIFFTGSETALRPCLSTGSICLSVCLYVPRRKILPPLFVIIADAETYLNVSRARPSPISRFRSPDRRVPALADTDAYRRLISRNRYVPRWNPGTGCLVVARSRVRSSPLLLLLVFLLLLLLSRFSHVFSFPRNRCTGTTRRRQGDAPRGDRSRRASPSSRRRLPVYLISRDPISRSRASTAAGNARRQQQQRFVGGDRFVDDIFTARTAVRGNQHCRNPVATQRRLRAYRFARRDARRRRSVVYVYLRLADRRARRFSLRRWTTVEFDTIPGKASWKLKK